jgi:hypothetical protein
MVSVPVRAAVAALAAAEYPTVPTPVPDAPDVTVSQLALEEAVHVQLLPAVTETLPVDASAAIAAEADEMDGEHGVDVVNGLESALAAVPPGPTADTVA